jgi:NADH-quinone oxidoreductase subunit G
VHQLRSAAEASTRPVILYASDLTTTVYAALRAMPAQTRFLPLVQGTNAVGASRLGLNTRPVRGDACYVLLGDDMPPRTIAQNPAFMVVQASYPSEWTESADVILPARTWAEQRGHIVNLEGRTLQVNPVVKPPPSVPPAWEILLQLSVRMGCALAYEQIPDIATAL